MILPQTAQLLDVCEATWPPAKTFDAGPFTLREGAGGGKRVSAATLHAGASPTDEDLHQAEEAMRAMDQTPLFQIRGDDAAFDAQLDAAGYSLIDPVRLYVIAAQDLTDLALPRITTFCIWEPLAATCELWAEGGIGPERFEVMQRATCAKTSLLGRVEDSPAAAGYVGIHQQIAMLHALEVTPAKRRKGLAQWMVRQAAVWAIEHEATHLSALCTDQNAAANALYEGLGFTQAGGYHYRIKSD